MDFLGLHGRKDDRFNQMKGMQMQLEKKKAIYSPSNSKKKIEIAGQS